MSEHDPRLKLRTLAKRFYRRGWMEGTAGNLSMREGNTLFITASGRSKGSLTREDILAVPMDGQGSPLTGDRRPSAEISIHRALYDIFPETGAVLHIHTIDAALISENSSENLFLPPLEVLKGLGVPDPFQSPPLLVFENDLRVQDIAEKMRVRLSSLPSSLPALLIRYHGTTAWGKSLDEAVRHLELTEFCLRFMVAKGLYRSQKT